MKARLDGQVRDGAAAAINGATVRLLGGIETLGCDPEASCLARGAVTWTRALTGFSGSMWNCWEKFVAPEVAGITWPEFRAEVTQYNPSLQHTDGRLQADATYYLPENARHPGMPEIVWKRPLTGFAGSAWDCWRSCVRGKIVGLRWKDFRDGLKTHNPQLAASNGSLVPDQEYCLPGDPAQASFVRVDYTRSAGRFAFDKLAPGSYHLEVSADGYNRLLQPVELGAGHATVTVTLEPVKIARAPKEGPPAPFGAAVPRAAPTEESPFIGVQGRRFVLGGRSFAFIGVNLRGLAYYGTPNMPFANAHQELSAARDMGARVVRIFLPNRDCSTSDARERLRALVQLMKQDFPSMYLIVALTNLYGDVPFCVPGDQPFYVSFPGGGPQILSLDWFRQAFRDRYQPFVEEIVKEFRDEPVIMAYDIGNELKAEGDPALLIQFIHTVARRIRQLDPNHLITTGMISTRHAFMAGRDDLRVQLYDTDALDFITNHSYHLDNNAPSPEDDSDLSARLNKPLLIEEAGFVSNQDRTELYAREMDMLFGRGASGYMPWGFMSGSDNGDGDRELGVDRVWHADWDSLNQRFRDRARQLADSSVPIPRSSSLFAVGQRIFTTTAVKVRRSPGLAGKPAGDVLQVAPTRSAFVVQGESAKSDGLVWWPVRPAGNDSAETGWIAQVAPSGEVLLSAV